MNTATFCPASRQEWRQWLQENHLTSTSIWMIRYKKQANMTTISWSEAVDEALCFGWIDSVAKPIDADSFMQFFTPRKPKSMWSKINKDKVEKLIAAGLMTPAGMKCIHIAKENGSWTILDTVDALKIPPDLEKAFKTKRGSKKHFLSLSRSVQKNYLQQLVLAKKPETRQKRIIDILLNMNF